MKKEIDSLFIRQIELLQKCQNNFIEGKEITIASNFFNEFFLANDIRKSEEHFDLFKELKKITSPVLYWFSIDSSNTSANDIRNHYKEFYKNFQSRRCSSFNPNCDLNSTILYLGKVKSGFWGRLITHLGYSKSAQTAGLQLYHWFSFEKFSCLSLNYIVFEKEMENLVSVFEVELAKKFKPIIGRY